MQKQRPSFTIRFFNPSDASSRELDDALAVYAGCVSPLLKTSTNEIRHKVAHPAEPEGRFYFASLQRHRRVVGFAMFGHYPARRLIVIDHMAIEEGGRGGAAFYVFAQGIQDYVDANGMQADFAAVELERDGIFGSAQTGGRDMVRLLGQIGFGEVHADYPIADLEHAGRSTPHAGILMLRAHSKLHSIRRQDLLGIYRSVLFDHYLPWCRSFMGDGLPVYATYLQGLYATFEGGLASNVVAINGPEADTLLRDVQPAIGMNEVRAAVHAGMFVVVAAGVFAALHYSGADLSEKVLGIVESVMAYAAVVAVSEGKAGEVFEKTLLKLPGGTRRSRYPPPSRTQVSSRGAGRKGRSGSPGPGS